MRPRCAHPECKKKLTFTELQMECKCGQTFCTKHQFYTDHECKFDYVKSAKEVLIQKNPKVENRQVEII